MPDEVGYQSFIMIKMQERIYNIAKMTDLQRSGCT